MAESATSLRTLIEPSLRAVAGISHNADLRRLELAAAGSNVGGWAYTVAVAVFAYDSGGATEVGVVAALRLLIAALAAPWAAVLADRFARRRVMIGADLVRASALVLAAGVVAAGGPAVGVYALVVVGLLATTTFRPAESAILPSLARSPFELTAANVVANAVESVALFAGPALGGAVLAVAGVEAVFFVSAALFLWSALLVVRIGRERAGSEEPSAEDGVGALAFGGLRLVGKEPRVRLLVGLFAAQTFVDGVLNVLIVVSALEVLDLGEAGVGFLNSAVGVGGLAGAAGALMLTARRTLAPPLAAGMLLFGMPLVVIAVVPVTAAALTALAVLGIGNTLIDVAGYTLLQRAVPDEVLGRVFGVLESVVLGSLAAGALIAPLLVSLVGARGALGAAGALLPLLVVVMWRPLAAIDAAARLPQAQIALLRGVPIFAALPEATLEALASELVEVRHEPGAQVVRQGDVGDRFYVVAEGELAVAADGTPRPRLGPGDFFGEIALLRDVPRTATVTAADGVLLYALPRDQFIAAVTGHAPSADAAEAVAATRLASLRPTVSSL